MIVNTINLTTPLCFLSGDRMLCYQNRKVLVMQEGKVEKKIPISVGVLEKLLGWSRLATRLLRFGVRVATVIDNTHAIICIGNKLHEVDIERGSVSKGWYCGDGVRPLIMTYVKGINGFKDGVYFGGYFMNMGKKPVHIYHRIGVDNWEIVYSFADGEINHVHNIVSDPYRQCLWIFTGDFDEAAAIYKVTEGFGKVDRVVCNNQKYRGCVVYALSEGLLYATDSPYAENHIRIMDVNTFETKSLFPLHGSCIYGCIWKSNYVFSSTVEDDGRTHEGLKLFYNGNRGAGIKDDYTHLYMGNLSEGFREVYKEEKDNMSFLFQFAVFKFPYGENKTNTLYFQPMATKKNDMKMLGLTL